MWRCVFVKGSEILSWLFLNGYENKRQTKRDEESCKSYEKEILRKNSMCDQVG